MATSLATSTSLLPEVSFIRPRRLRISLSRFQYLNSKSSKSGFRIRLEATRGESIAVVEEEERENLNGAYLNGNGSSGYGYNGLSKNSNGSANVTINGNGVSNGSLVKYVNGNGFGKKVVENESESKSEEGRKHKLEDIEQEEAWFKRGGRDKLKVENHMLFRSAISSAPFMMFITN